MKVEERISTLYSLPLAEFTAARNDLAKELRATGDGSTADEVKKLPKPSVSAWAINQLYWEQRATFDALLAAGREQREALRSSASGLRSIGERKRGLQAELLRAAEEVLGRAGTRLSPALRQRLSRTLDALAAWPPGAEGPRLGRLAADVEPSGFDALLGARIAPSDSGRRGQRAKRARVQPKRETASNRRRRQEARSAIERAQKELAQAVKEETAAKGKLTRADLRARRALEKAKAAELAAEKAREIADAAQLELRKARTARERAAQATERLEARADTAKRKLADLD